MIIYDGTEVDRLKAWVLRFRTTAIVVGGRAGKNWEVEVKIPCSINGVDVWRNEEH